MSLGTVGQKETIRQVIRGERPWSDLNALGITLCLEGDRCTVDNPDQIEVTAGLRDLALGFLSYQSDPATLRRWALMMEAESFVDWGDAELDPDWETLWGAIWNASFGEPILAEAVDRAKQLV